MNGFILIGNPVTFKMNNLIGPTVPESQRLLSNALYDDNAKSTVELKKVKKIYKLIVQDAVLSFEFETANFYRISSLTNLNN